MNHSLRRLGVTTALALVAGLATVSPASAGAAECGPAPVSNNNTVGNQAPVANNDTITKVANKPVLAGLAYEIPVLGNDTDPERDTLALVSAGRADRTELCPTANGTVRFVADASPNSYRVSFRYGMTDGDFYRSAVATVTVTGVKPVGAQLRSRLTLRPNGKVRKPAQVVFTNTNPVAVTVLGGNARNGELFLQRTVGAGKSIVVNTRVKRMLFVSVIEDDSSALFVNVGTVNTRNGKVRSQYIGESMSESDFRSTGARGALARYAR